MQNTQSKAVIFKKRTILVNKEVEPVWTVLEHVKRNKEGELIKTPGGRNTDGWSILLTCPSCSQPFALRRKVGAQAPVRGHTVADDGTVSPAVLCPGKGCRWSAPARLEDWTGDPP